MWVLLLTITLLDSPPAVKVIMSYPSQDECEQERTRILAAFDEAYPVAERDYTFACKPVHAKQRSL